MLELKALKKSYNSHLILDIEQLDLTEGMYWMQCKNGSGKTTLMKILAGIIPFEGSVELNSVNLIKDPIAYRRQINYAEAEPLYPSFLTGKELVKFVQSARKDSDLHIEALIDIWGIRDFLNDRIETYSSGMIKKLSLAMAFIGNTRLILLDEPLITLEDAALPILFKLMSDRAKDGASFLFTSHQAFPESELSLIGKIMIENQTARME